MKTKIIPKTEVIPSLYTVHIWKLKSFHPCIQFTYENWSHSILVYSSHIKPEVIPSLYTVHIWKLEVIPSLYTLHIWKLESFHPCIQFTYENWNHYILVYSSHIKIKVIPSLYALHIWKLKSFHPCIQFTYENWSHSILVYSSHMKTESHSILVYSSHMKTEVIPSLYTVHIWKLKSFHPCIQFTYENWSHSILVYSSHMKEVFHPCKSFHPWNYTSRIYQNWNHSILVYSSHMKTEVIPSLYTVHMWKLKSFHPCIQFTYENWKSFHPCIQFTYEN